MIYYFICTNFVPCIPLLSFPEQNSMAMNETGMNSDHGNHGNMSGDMGDHGNHGNNGGDMGNHSNHGNMGGDMGDHGNHGNNGGDTGMGNHGNHGRTSGHENHGRSGHNVSLIRHLSFYNCCQIIISHQVPWSLIVNFIMIMFA